jgi:RNA dependent RNA polymerase
VNRVGCAPHPTLCSPSAHTEQPLNSRNINFPTPSTQCTGGDLDGDHFALVWDPLLIPPETRQFPAFDYDASGRAREKALSLASGRVESESRYMVDCMSASIGKVAVLHQCVCDILPLGAREPLAILLAEQASVAVDQPKSGLEPLIPGEGVPLGRRYCFFCLSRPHLCFDLFRFCSYLILYIIFLFYLLKHVLLTSLFSVFPLLSLFSLFFLFPLFSLFPCPLSTASIFPVLFSLSSPSSV